MAFSANQFNYATPFDSSPSFEDDGSAQSTRFFTLHNNDLTGDYQVIDGDVGMMGTSISDENGELDPYIMNIYDQHQANIVKIVANCIPKDFTIEILDNGVVIDSISVTDNEDPEYVWERELPYPYQKVEYIESTGTQYIDTGLIGNVDNVYIKIIFEITNFAKDYMALFGGSNNSLKMQRLGSTQQLYLNSITGQNVYTSALNVNTEYILEINQSNEVFLNENKIGSLSSIGDGWGLDKSMYLLNYHHSPSLTFNGKIKESIMYDDNQSRHLIPCYDTTDPTKHTAGLYDIVNNQFYANQGTGYFLIGPEV